jgi:hypothetical protein
VVATLLRLRSLFRAWCRPCRYITRGERLQTEADFDAREAHLTQTKSWFKLEHWYPLMCDWWDKNHLAYVLEGVSGHDHHRAPKRYTWQGSWPSDR